MPPRTEVYAGQAAIRGFVAEALAYGPWRFLPARANAQLAFGTYLWDSGRGVHAAAALEVLELRGSRVAGVVSFLGPERFATFGLPDEFSDAAGLRGP